MSSTTLTLHPLENAQAFGCPYHGEVTRIDGELKVTLPNAETRKSYAYGNPFYVKHPTAVGPTRTAEQAAEDTRLGRTWLDYGLLSYGTSFEGIPGMRFSGCVYIPPNRYLYCDEFRVWTIRVEFIAHPVYTTLYEKLELWLDGSFGRMPSALVCTIKLTTITLNYLVELNSTPLSDRVAFAPSPDGRKWFINTYETVASSAGSFWAGNSLFSAFTFGGTQQICHILREVWKVEITGNGEITGTIGDNITATATIYKDSDDNFTQTIVEPDAIPECPTICPSGTPGDSSSGSTAGSNVSSTSVGYWYDKDGVEQTGTIAYSHTYSASWEGQRNDEGTCFLYFTTNQSKTMSRTITLPGHTETQNASWSAVNECEISYVETGDLWGPWGKIVTVDGAPFAEYSMSGWAGILGGTVGSFFSKRESSSAQNVTIDYYGHTALSPNKWEAVPLHPLTGAGDSDTKGWI